MQTAEQILEEVEIDIGDLKFNVVDADVALSRITDSRTFVDKCFTNRSPDGTVSLKPIRKIKCVGNDEPSIAKGGEIAVLLNYKAVKLRGRRPPLAGEDVLHISCPSGDIRIPVDQAEALAKYIMAIAKSLKKESSDE